MFKPLQMRGVKVLVLDSYLDRVMNILGKLKSIQITEVKERGMEISREKLLDRYSTLLDSTHRLIDILKIQDGEVEKVPMAEKSPEGYLDEVEGRVNRIKEDATSLSEKLEEMLREKAVLECNELALNCLDKLRVDVNWLGTSDFLHVSAGFLDPEDVEELESRMKEAAGEDHMILTKSFEDKIIAFAVTLKEHQNEVDGILRGLNFDELVLTGRDLKGIRERLNLIKETEDSLQTNLERIRDENLRDILIAKEIAQIGKNIQEMVLGFGRTGRVYAVEGWVPAKEADDLVREVENASEGCAVIHLCNPKPGENVPVSFDNPKPLKPFESIVGMFGLPSYTEIDPTPILAITFPLIFGLMFGDVGHGAIMALAGLGMVSLKRNVESYWNFGMILLYCGISAVLFGFLYGSILGNEEILLTLWMKPSHHLMDAIGVALFIGVLHMGAGLIVNAVNKSHESGLHTLVHSLSKLWFFCGEIVVIAAIFTFPIPLFIQVAGMYPLTTIILYGICIPIALMLLTELIHESNPFKVTKLLGVLGSGSFEVFETFSMFLSNTISYSRIAILAVIHAMMMMAIYEISGVKAIADLFPLGILIMIGGNILVVVLEGLIVFIHTIRLHFYEWFTKFYVAEGVKYAPFIVERKYTKLPD